jgi:uncharacterized protein YkwD
VREVRSSLSAAVALALSLLILAPGAALAGDFDDEVLAEVNFARAHPAAYARELRDETRRPDDGYSSLAYEDRDAVEEAIDFLMRQTPLPPLQPDDRLAAAARAHTVSQGPRGELGHGAPGSLGQRLQHNGLWAGLAAEDISYGHDTARDVVRQLIIDSGVPNRGHRNNIFGRAYQVAGVGCGRHSVYGSMCVIDFAGALVQR